MALVLGGALLTAAVVAALLHLSGRMGAERVRDDAGRATGDEITSTLSFVGSASCAGCHADEFAKWEESQHARAMQHATPETVLGAFDGRSFTHAGVTTTFFRRDSLFWVRTRGADGVEGDFQVRYTFGVHPLQQYLVELTGGRVQPLTVAWDSRAADQGGQRWMTLYPGERIEHTDELHWTGPQQNWNFMCADCHSTGVRKNYDRADDAFATTWSEIDVGCEACHGPGSGHLKWARQGERGEVARNGLGLSVALDEREGVVWQSDPSSGLPVRSEPLDTEREVAVCARCHSRRAQIAEGYQAGNEILDHYLPSLIMPGLYYPDGQQRDEVYTHVSFQQSRMFAAGVTCSDCHDPHTQRLRAAGNAVCATCHAPARYDTSAHHFHRAESEAGACVSCHMPETTYMRIDPRRDHSIRVPRPDRSVALGVPNACSACHTDRSAEWAAAAVRDRYGEPRPGFQSFAEAFAAHERGEEGAAASLAAIARDAGQPAVVRASALARLGERPSLVAFEAARAGLADPHPLARRTALTLLEAVPPARRVALAAPLLSDPVRIVRQQAAWVLAPAFPGLDTPILRNAFTRASNEFIESQRFLADRPENRLTLGTYFALLGRNGEAEAEYRAALRMAPTAIAAYVNLADLYRATGREADAENLLREGLGRLPSAAGLHHALGLSLARSGRTEEARESLARAARLEPGQPQYAYAHAVALHSTGRVAEAIRTAGSALERHPTNYDLLFALATFHRDAGRPQAARDYARRLRDAHPDDAAAAQLLRSLD